MFTLESGDRFYEFLAFFFRIGVVKTQVAFAVEILRQTKIQTDGFGMADMQITVRLGRKAGYYALVLATGQIGFNRLRMKLEAGTGGLLLIIEWGCLEKSEFYPKSIKPCAYADVILLDN